MQRNVNSLLGYSMEAKDGEIGTVEEFYFDDATWTIRYLIVKTGGWLSGRKVLISPDALIDSFLTSGTFPVNLTQEQVRNSPDIDTDMPVSRQQEIALSEHYPWQSYWSSGFYPGGIWGITNSSPFIDEEVKNEAGISHKKSDYDPHLRSTGQVTGYHIHAADGDIGHVNDFIIDDQTWQLAYLVVDTHNWFGGKKVLIAVRHIKEVEWDTSRVIVNITMDAIKNSIGFEESKFSHPETSNIVYDNLL